jgi:hypothetical protein
MTRLRIPASIAFATLLFTRSIGGGNAPPSEIHAIVELNEHCLIGGVQGQKWVRAERFEKRVASPLKFELYTLEGPAGEVTLRKRTGECHDYWYRSSGALAKTGIAVSSPSWNVMPRLPKALDVKDPAYLQIVRDILKGAGLKNPHVSISQAYAIDLDGDGVDEVVIVANRFVEGAHELGGLATQAQAGDYTLVLVRKTIGQQTQNIFVVKWVWLEPGGVLARANHLSAIADLNGDGVMELVVYSAYYEGSDSDVVQLNGGNKATAPLECACEH